WYRDLDPEVEHITTGALERLQHAGVTLVESELPGLAELIDCVTYPVQNHDVRPSLTRYLEQHGAGVSFEELLRNAGPDIQESFRTEVMPGGAHFVTDATYHEVVRTHLPALQRLYRDYFSRTGVEAIVFPATRIPATIIGTTTVKIRGREVAFDD